MDMKSNISYLGQEIEVEEENDDDEEEEEEEERSSRSLAGLFITGTHTPAHIGTFPIYGVLLYCIWMAMFI